MWSYVYLKRLKSADGGLGEDVSVERAERQSDVGLREAEFDSSLFELASERLEVVRRRRLQHFVVVDAAITTSGRRRAARRAVGARRRVGHLRDVTRRPLKPRTLGSIEEKNVLQKIKKVKKTLKNVTKINNVCKRWIKNVNSNFPPNRST